MTDYKTLRNRCSCHGGTGKWTPYKPKHVDGDLVPCQHGLHYCRDEQVVGWIDQEIWKFVDLAPNETIAKPDKMVTREGMITEKCKHWTKRAAALFAVDCARQALNRHDLGDEYTANDNACLDVIVGYIEGYCDYPAAAATTRLSAELHDESFHTVGHVEACEKGNEAALLGWAVYRFTRDVADSVNLACQYRRSQTMEYVANTASGAASMALPDTDVTGTLSLIMGYIDDAAEKEQKAQYDILLRYLNGEEGPFVEEE